MGRSAAIISRLTTLAAASKSPGIAIELEYRQECADCRGALRLVSPGHVLRQKHSENALNSLANFSNAIHVGFKLVG
jgi:hypothetical protein